MPAYILVTREKTRDKNELDAYMEIAKPTFAAYGSKLLVRSGNPVTLEGPAPEAVFLLEFATVEAALAWYDSEEYKKARAHRFLGGDYRFILVDGL
jgi:uncharacterized protein (DUF1330 family)